MLRNTVLILAILLSGLAARAYALELGSVTVESYQNQPLAARIEILNLGATRLEDIRIQLAAPDDFTRLNIDRAAFQYDLQFRTQTTANGNFLLLTSNRAVSEPNLDLFIDIRWPGGRQLSRQNLRLDLPAFRTATSNTTSSIRRLVTPGDLGRSEIVRRPGRPVPELNPVRPPPRQRLPVPLPPRERLPVPELNVADSFDDRLETLRVNPGDTLTSIAQQVRPNALTLSQTMLALLEANPEAFIEGNINRLRSGQILRIPSRRQIEAVDAAIAAAEVARQNRQYARLQPLVPAPTPSGRNRQRPPGQLSVVTSDAATDGRSGAGNSANPQDARLDARIADLQNRLALRREEADRIRIERAELDSRLAALEQQIIAAEEIIRLQDLQLAQLQQSIAEAAERSGPDATNGGGTANPLSMLEQLRQTLAGSTSTPVFTVGSLGLALLLFLLLVMFILRRRRSAYNAELNALSGRGFNRSAQNGGVLYRSAAAGNAMELSSEDDFEEELDFILSKPRPADPSTTRRTLHRGSANTAATRTQQTQAMGGGTDNEAQGTQTLQAQIAEQAQRPQQAQQADQARQAEQAEQAERARQAELAERARQAEQAERARQAEQAERARQAELARQAEQAEKARQAELAERARQAEQAEKARQAEQAEKARQAELAERARQAEQAEKARQAEQAEKARQAEQAEKARQAEQAEKARLAERAEQALKAEQAEKARQAEQAEKARQAEQAEKARQAAQSEKTRKVTKAGQGAAIPQGKAPQNKSENATNATQPAASKGNSDDFGFIADNAQAGKKTAAATEQQPKPASADTKMEDAVLFGEDEAATKLELAYAYQQMGDLDGAKEILREVVTEGNTEQKREAEKLLASLA